MQMRLPIFPKDTKLINAYLGVREQDGTVYYLQNGLPVHCHAKSDLSSYRYITALLVTNKLCRSSELADALGVNRRNIERYAQSLREKGPQWFFNRTENRGKSYRMTGSFMEQAQELLDAGKSGYYIAKQLGISEGTVRYHLKQGNLKKKGRPKSIRSGIRKGSQ